MDPPLISDGQTRSSNPEQYYDTLLPFPNSNIGSLIYLIKNNKDSNEKCLEWLNQASKRLAEIRNCDFELLTALPSNYSFFSFIYSPDNSHNLISNDSLVDEESKRKYNEIE